MKKHSKVGFSLIEMSMVILVIGILVTGIAQGSRIIADSRLKAATTLTMSSVVVATSDLVFWLDTTNINNLTPASGVVGDAKDGDRISVWQDRSPHNPIPFQFTQSTSVQRPIYVQNGLNGLPSLQFDRTELRRLSATSDVSVADNQARTLFMVFDNTSDNGTGSFGAEIFGMIRSRSLDVDPGSAVTNQLTARSSLVTDVTASSSTNAVRKSKHILTVIGYSGGVIARRNGVQIINSATLGFDYALSTVYIGGTADNIANSLYSGTISEVILFGRKLQTTEITAIEDYLSKKYAIRI
jgi:prepilin-type N-terminal cleavage/methylation domain-containing protein